MICAIRYVFTPIFLTGELFQQSMATSHFFMFFHSRTWLPFFCKISSPERLHLLSESNQYSKATAFCRPRYLYLGIIYYLRLGHILRTFYDLYEKLLRERKMQHSPHSSKCYAALHVLLGLCMIIDLEKGQWVYYTCISMVWPRLGHAIPHHTYTISNHTSKCTPL